MKYVCWHLFFKINVLTILKSFQLGLMKHQPEQGVFFWKSIKIKLLTSGNDRNMNQCTCLFYFCGAVWVVFFFLLSKWFPVLHTYTSRSKVILTLSASCANLAVHMLPVSPQESLSMHPVCKFLLCSVAVSAHLTLHSRKLSPSEHPYLLSRPSSPPIQHIRLTQHTSTAILVMNPLKKMSVH